MELIRGPWTPVGRPPQTMRGQREHWSCAQVFLGVFSVVLEQYFVCEMGQDLIWPTSTYELWIQSESRKVHSFLVLWFAIPNHVCGSAILRPWCGNVAADYLCMSCLMQSLKQLNHIFESWPFHSWCVQTSRTPRASGEAGGDSVRAHWPINILPLR